LCVITSGKGFSVLKSDQRIQILGFEFEVTNNSIGRLLAIHIYAQIIYSFYIIKSIKSTHIWVFSIGSDTLLLPLLTAKIIRKPVVLLLIGSSSITWAQKNQKLTQIVKCSSSINRGHSDRIVVYSKNMIYDWDLKDFEQKVKIAHEHFLDFNRFSLSESFNKRESAVGYIGRLSEEKGILNFMNGILKISRYNNHIKFLVGGDGMFHEKVENFINTFNLNPVVEFPGWIDHSDLPRYLNRLKLIVLPSSTEGLPNIMLEAMACGTPVLSTPVGAIPDIIKDGETGFLMENNSPECIAANVIRALEHPDLEGVAMRARALVEREFTFEKAVERWRKILEEVGDGRS
jgi:glycosyltransferase involved in cell wall biosynthesis